MRLNCDHYVTFGFCLDTSLEKIAYDGKLGEDRKAGNRLRLFLPHQSANDNGFSTPHRNIGR